MDTLKTQLLTMMMIKGQQSESSLYGFIVLTVIDHVFKITPQVLEWIKSITFKYIEGKASKAIPLLQTTNESSDPKSRIQLTGRLGENDSFFNAIVETITNSDDCTVLTYNKYFFLGARDELRMAPQINAKVLGITVEEGGKRRIEIEIYSHELSMSKLRRFLTHLHERYQMEAQNKLGEKTYYFKEVVQSLPLLPNGQPHYAMAPKMIEFTKKPFHTNRRFTNLFGEEMKEIRRQVEFFIHNRKWYEDKGQPYTLGILLSGAPGLGKTSTIKCIARETERHIININLHGGTTKTQLDNLFYNEKIVCKNPNGSSETYTIPVDKRLYIIEDIDCMADVVLDRGSVKEEEEDHTMKEYFPVTSVKQPETDKQSPEKLDLSFLLNILDGVLETPGRIIIMTSNYPDKLDKALIRPGRIDIAVDFKKCSRSTIKEMIEFFYDTEIESCEVEDKQWTPAEVTRVLFGNTLEKSLEILSTLGRP